MIEIENSGAELSCFEWIRGHWYTEETASSSQSGEAGMEQCRRVVGVAKFARRSVGKVDDGTSCPCLRELVEPHSVSRPRRVAGPLATQFMALRIEKPGKRKSLRRLRSAAAILCAEYVERSGLKSQLPDTSR